jgi:hypothetical protein
MTDIAKPSTSITDQEVRWAANVVASQLIADRIRDWQIHLATYAQSPLGVYTSMGDENWKLVLAAIKGMATVMAPDAKTYQTAHTVLTDAAEAAQEDRGAAEGDD